jgi:uracil-DNA glycosylase
MGVDSATFYDEARVAVVPMGFCFPGLDAHKADLPPRRECRPKWHDALFAVAPRLDLILAVGRYAHDYHLPRLGHASPKGESVTDTVSNWRAFSATSPKIFPLPHPSWRNSGWLKRNPWFETELLPHLRAEVARAIGS